MNILHRQQQLKNWGHSGLPKIPKTTWKKQLIWLDPVQSKILRDSIPRQIIFGPASTGKTVLIQIKASETVRKFREQKNVVVVPNKELKEKYDRFFDREDLGEGRARIIVMTAAEDFLKCFKEGCNVFFDEFCASVAISEIFLQRFEKLLELIPAFHHQLVWITADFHQSLEDSWFETSASGIILNRSEFCRTYLGLIHRCTLEVLKTYLDFCGPLLHPKPHQVIGTKEERILIDNTREKVDLNEMILLEIGKQSDLGWQPEQIAVIVVLDSPFMIFLWHHLKKNIRSADVLLEKQTLSQEWPVVIVCQTKSSETEGDPSYVAHSRAEFKIISFFITTNVLEENFLAGKFS